MSKKIVFALFSLLLITNWAYGQKQPVTTAHGFRFINHTNATGPKVTPGGSVMVEVVTWVGDSLMGTTNGAREYQLPEASGLPARVPFIYDAVLLMSKGDSATVYETIDSMIRPFIPPALASAKDVRYEIKVLDVITKADKDKAAAESEAHFQAVQTMVTKTVMEYKDGKLKLDTRPSGLKVLIVEPGKGEIIKANDAVKTNYYGCLTDGKLFDNSFQRGQTLDFIAGAGQMIPGFDEGVQLLHHGGKAYFFLPPSLAYGEQGAGDAVPPNAELIFYVEVL
ncbi:MAG: FKBP-type peptidyl-prolyl cis-trans isomerase [Saprospiraceae bacterium]